MVGKTVPSHRSQYRAHTRANGFTHTHKLCTWGFWFEPMYYIHSLWFYVRRHVVRATQFHPCNRKFFRANKFFATLFSIFAVVPPFIAIILSPAIMFGAFRIYRAHSKRKTISQRNMSASIHRRRGRHRLHGRHRSSPCM